MYVIWKEGANKKGEIKNTKNMGWVKKDRKEGINIACLILTSVVLVDIVSVFLYFFIYSAIIYWAPIPRSTVDT